jgi:hypothetical protein
VPRQLAVLLVFLVLAGGITACGGDDDSGRNSSATAAPADDTTNGESGDATDGGPSEVSGEEITRRIPRPEFIAGADQICLADGRLFLKRVAPLLKQGKVSPEDSQQFAAAVDNILIPVLESRVERIKELGLPRPGTAAALEYLAAMEAGIEEAKSKPIDDYWQFEAAFNRATKLARAYGFRYCG